VPHKDTRPRGQAAGRQSLFNQPTINYLFSNTALCAESSAFT